MKYRTCCKCGRSVGKHPKTWKNLAYCAKHAKEILYRHPSEHWENPKRHRKSG